MKQVTIKDSFKKDKFDQTTFEHHVVEFIVGADLPFLLIENEKFWDLVKYLNPGVTKFKADKFKQLVMKEFDKMQAQIKSFVQGIESRISFSTDVWTSPNSLSFMAVHAHFVDAEYKLNSLMLDFAMIPGSHTGERINTEFTNVVRESYQIDNKRQGPVTMDNASSNDTFFQGYAEDFGIDMDYRYRCYCHCQNLAVQRALEAIQPQLETLRNGIRYIRSSPKMFDRMKNVYQRLNGTMQGFIRPSLDVVTRWDSTQIMTSDALKMKSTLQVNFRFLSF